MGAKTADPPANSPAADSPGRAEKGDFPRIGFHRGAYPRKAPPSVLKTANSHAADPRPAVRGRQIPPVDAAIRYDAGDFRRGPIINS